jgi:WS/DGAT/MGAT family acyltransferase
MWQDDPDFDIAHHVRHARVPAPGTRAEFEALCCELQMKVLDRSKPLWEMWFVDGLVDGSVGLVYKVHHAVVDGVSAAETFEVLLGGEMPTPVSGAASPPRTPVQRLVSAAVDDARSAARLWLGTGATFVSKPAMAVGTAVGLGHLVRPAALAPRTSLEGPIGRNRRLVPVGFELADVKAVARRFDVTVNDVVLTMVGAGLGALFEGRGDRTDHVQVLVPVSLRGHGQHDGVGNRVAGLMVTVPIERDPLAALAAISSETRALKSGPEAGALDLLLRMSDTWPVGLLGPASRQIVHHQPFVNLVVTNVRGAERPLSLLGSRILEIVPLVPLAENLSLGVAILSYAGRIVMGLHADADACPDVDAVADGIRTCFAELQAAAPPVSRRESAGRG